MKNPNFITTVVVAAGGGGAVAVWLCKLFGEKCLIARATQQNSL
jgi:hypoxanthine phosphoribosyltransferase